MNITIIENEVLKRAVSARELHKFLGSREQFTDWCKRMISYLKFQAGDDFLNIIVFHKNMKNPDTSGGRPSKEYLFTIKAAKKIAMLQRTDKGEEAREYFIECEERYLQQREQQLTTSALPNFSNPYEAALAWAEAYKQKEIAQAERDEAIKTKAWIGNKREATAMATASLMTRKVNKLEDELGRGKNFKAVTAIKGLSEYFYINKKLYHKLGILLRNLSISRGYKIIKIPHSGYRGEVNAYDVELIQEFMNEIDINPYIKDKLAEFRKY